MTCRVVLADPNAVQREGIRRVLEQDGFEIIAETGSGEDALRLAIRWRPDVVLMGTRFPDGDGADLTRRVMSSDPGLRVVLLGHDVDESVCDAAIDAGAYGVLTTRSTLGDITQALSRVADGDMVVSPSGVTRTRTADHTASTARASGLSRTITTRERAVLQAIVDGLTCREAAARMFISPKTLKNHLGSIYVKLDAHDRTQAVLTALRLGLVSLD